jgi:hypothetical protein
LCGFEGGIKFADGVQGLQCASPILRADEFLGALKALSAPLKSGVGGRVAVGAGWGWNSAPELRSVFPAHRGSPGLFDDVFEALTGVFVTPEFDIHEGERILLGQAARKNGFSADLRAPTPEAYPPNPPRPMSNRKPKTLMRIERQRDFLTGLIGWVSSSL